MVNPNSHWRDSARQPRFFLLDYRATFPLLAFLLSPNWTTLIATCVCALFLGILQYFGFTVPVFSRWIVSFLAGPLKPSRPWWTR